jgi:transposase-like protein
LSYLDAEVAWKSHRKLTRALSALRERAWFHYMDLRAVYLEDGSNPRLIEKWRQQVAQENHGGAKRRLRVIEEAIEFILDEVGEYRLTVPLPPTGGKGTKDHERRRRRYNALISFYDRLETGASPTEAVREVAAEYSTNASTVWRWVKEMGG